MYINVKNNDKPVQKFLVRDSDLQNIFTTVFPQDISPNSIFRVLTFSNMRSFI